MKSYSLVKNRLAIIYAIVLLLIGFGTYFTNYDKPDELFWDENYHIPSAQKYIDGVMFMEPHPPLGKMLLALGEYLVGANDKINTKPLIASDYIKMKPKNLSFAGYRLIPVLSMIFAVVLFFFILVNITQNLHISLLFSTPLLFDNALIVHSRGAMLESIQLFFVLAAIFYLSKVIKTTNITLSSYAILGLLVGLAISVKINSSILIFLIIFLFIFDNRKALRNKQVGYLLKRFLVAIPISVMSILLVFLFFMYLHIFNGKNIERKNTYKASNEYQQLIDQGNTYSLSTFTIALRDNFKFTSKYNDGVPRLNPCKKGENGSYPMKWPLGAKTINYRWNKSTEEGQPKARYLYLQSNPIVWLSALVGIILSVSLLISRFVYGNPVKDKKLFWWITAISVLYLCYMIAILQIDRVMYLYHYFIPLIFALLNLPLVFCYLFKDEILNQTRHTYVNIGIFVFLIVVTYYHFTPLTYYSPLSESEFQLRQWFDFWQLTSVTG